MMEASPSGKISSKLVVHFLRNTGSIKNEREASPQRNNHKAKRISKILIYEFFNVLSAYYLYCLNTIDRFIKFSAYDKKELSIRAIQCHYRFIIHYYCPSLSSY